MDWVEDFYSRTGAWWAGGEARITERDHRRVRLLRAHAGDGPLRVLELGAAYGTTAAVAAADGFLVTAVEISDRADHAPETPGLTMVRGDFYRFDAAARFDAVCYWNGFGVGDDADQRRLLRRIAADWLAPGGVALIDVFNPFVWARWDGDEEHKLPDPARGYEYELREQTRFDPVTCVASDTWWDVAAPERKITQRLRCYTPADLALLIEGTGLRLAGIVLGEERVEDRHRPRLLTEEAEYLAVLVSDR